MYLKEKNVRLLRIKNIIFTFIGVFSVFVCGFYIISEFTYYRDNPYLAWHAKSMASSIAWVIIGAILLIEALISRNLIGKATFYSGYFEGSLDGWVKCSDLAQVVGKKEEKVKRQLSFFRKIYMKKFEMAEKDGEAVAELYSKKSLCECRNCGANMEKRIFFTGACPYCQSSDLFAKILTDNRFYSISNEIKTGEKKPAFYTGKYQRIKKIVVIVLTAIFAFLAMIGLMMALSEFPHYFDREYQKEILLSPESYLRSYELIQADILDTVLFATLMFLIFMPLVIGGIRRIISIVTSGICAGFFAKCKKPFVDAEKLPDIGIISDSKRKLKCMRNAIHRGDLVNCTLEVHDDRLMAVLAKKIVKDRCQSCGSPIVGAVDENYVCKSCGRLIMGVVEKG